MGFLADMEKRNGAACLDYGIHLGKSPNREIRDAVIENAVSATGCTSPEAAGK